MSKFWFFHLAGDLISSIFASYIKNENDALNPLGLMENKWNEHI